MDEDDFTNCPGCGKIIPKADNYCKHCGCRNRKIPSAESLLESEVRH